MERTESRNRSKLRDFYKSQARENAELVRNPQFNLDSSQFQKDQFIDGVLRQMPLAALLQKEREIGREISTLDQSMQSLVYDNYNKFIKATDTIKQMRVDFKDIEKSMDELVSEMSQISKLSTSLNSKMKPCREEVADLVEQQETLTKMQFLFELPAELKRKIEEGDFESAVQDYVKANSVLRNYENHPSFKSIQEECELEYKSLLEKLEEPFSNVDSKEELLIRCIRILKNSDQKINAKNNNLESFSAQISAVLAEICVSITSFKNIFQSKNLESSLVAQHAHQSLKGHVNDILEELTDDFSEILVTNDLSDDQLSTSLDLWYSKLSATAQILPELNLTGRSEELVVNQAKIRHDSIKKSLFMKLEEEILNIEKSESPGATNASILNLIQESQHQLDKFFTMSKSYSQIEYFLVEWNDMTKTLRVDAVEHIASFCQKTLQTAHPALLFPLSSLASIWSETTVDQCIERKDRQTVNRLKISFSQICSAALKELVLIRGCHCAELIHRSVMAKDWLNTSEPRGPRPIVKTFIDEIRKIDEECSKFMRQGVRPAKSTRSGSMRIETLSQRSNLNIQRLFTDKIEIYDVVQSTTISVTSGIIKIALKAMLESVRLKTFSSYGLQQIQVDLSCLHHILWRYCEDESHMSTISDEILQSAALRALERELMEADVIDLIVEKAQLA
ncbi:Oidioi.mRNA.OKI2018_I69.PAR.g10138.t1.cds [Oikopleura dioica]|uniref:Vacuolar protein sorting-associated protein 51 homolog n=1 Tax=Oikopleura dioica TaxID=34765 RepID=A0ABN7RT24_OIKDI|nr:Oidioi.mRNA.OKI2018_I69.PAR.g10138.t1.cds [Oikopleura dioica]